MESHEFRRDYSSWHESPPCYLTVESDENELSTDWLSKGPHRDGIERNPMAKIEIDFSGTTLDSVAQFSIGINIRESGLTRMI